MKLTKGRLSKIKKMKKQTRYNRKKSRKNENRETFRRRKSKHFLYKSLKNRRRVQKGGITDFFIAALDTIAAGGTGGWVSSTSDTGAERPAERPAVDYLDTELVTATPIPLDTTQQIEQAAADVEVDGVVNAVFMGWIKRVDDIYSKAKPPTKSQSWYDLLSGKPIPEVLMSVFLLEPGPEDSTKISVNVYNPEILIKAAGEGGGGDGGGEEGDIEMTGSAGPVTDAIRSLGDWATYAKDLRTAPTKVERDAIIAKSGEEDTQKILTAISAIKNQINVLEEDHFDVTKIPGLRADRHGDLTYKVDISRLVIPFRVDVWDKEGFQIGEKIFAINRGELTKDEVSHLDKALEKRSSYSQTQQTLNTIGRTLARAPRAAVGAVSSAADATYKGTSSRPSNAALDMATKRQLSECDNAVGKTLRPHQAGAFWQNNECRLKDRGGNIVSVLRVGTFINKGGYKKGNPNTPLGWDEVGSYSKKSDVFGLSNALVLNIESDAEDPKSYTLTVQNKVYKSLEKPIEIVIGPDAPKKQWTWKISDTSETQNLLWSIVGYKPPEGDDEVWGVITDYVPPSSKQTTGQYTIWQAFPMRDPATPVVANVGSSSSDNNVVITKVHDSFPKCAGNTNIDRRHQIPSELEAIETPDRESFNEAMDALKDKALLYGVGAAVHQTPDLSEPPKGGG